MTEWLSHPTGQIVLVAVIEVGVVAWLYRSRRRAAVVAAVAVPILGALVVVIDLARESPREQVDCVIGQVRRGVLEGDAQAVLRHIDPEYEHDGLTYEQLSAWLPVQLRLWRITSAHITNRQFTTVTARRITVRLSVRAAGRTALGIDTAARSIWRLTFLPLEDRWVLAEIEPIEINGRPFGRLADLP